MKTDFNKGAGTILYAAVLVVGAGCSSLHNRVSENSWTWTAEKEQLQQELSVSPQGDLDMVPLVLVP